MSILYRSTRKDSEEISASKAIIRGLAPDGGLYFPTSLPKLSVGLDELCDMTYQETAYVVLKEFLTDFTEDELKDCIKKAYDSKFDDERIAPLVEKNGKYFLELFHGPTIAFKDMALSILPHLLTTSMKKNGIDEEVMILTATSGDTGKAALAGFADVEGTSIVVFYPKGGVSRIQELQMVTEKGKNTKVVAVEGNFDDCQTGVKNIFASSDMNDYAVKCGYRFSSANSINIGRLVPQVAYYVYAYAKMCKCGAIKVGDEIDFVVPTGNFGNILSGYLAKQMGIPVGKFVCASNDNKVLYDFFKTGIYDRRREFILTSSPSMDILISSNLERLIYLSAGCNGNRNATLMQQLSENGFYEIDDLMKANMSDFVGYFATQKDVSDTIAELYRECGYVIDTHTAVAAYADKKYKSESESDNKSVIISTASPYKFAGSVVEAIDGKADYADVFDIVDRLRNISGVDLPNAVVAIRSADIIHKNVCAIDKMEDEVKEFLK